MHRGYTFKKIPIGRTYVMQSVEGEEVEKEREIQPDQLVREA